MIYFAMNKYIPFLCWPKCFPNHKVPIQQAYTIAQRRRNPTESNLHEALLTLTERNILIRQNLIIYARLAITLLYIVNPCSLILAPMILFDLRRFQVFTRKKRRKQKIWGTWHSDWNKREEYKEACLSRGSNVRTLWRWWKEKEEKKRKKNR